MENHLCQCIYDVLHSDTPETEKLRIPKRYKAKIVCLHPRRKEKLMLGLDVQDKIEDEEPTLFHILKRHKRCETTEVRVIQDRQEHIYIRPKDILDTFIMHLTQTYGHIDVDDNSIAIMKAAILQTHPTVYA